MGVAERRARQLAERETRILAAARAVAEREGWSAVTIRRLAAEIEHSQPVLYSHFANRDAIVGAVARIGFNEIASLLHDVAKKADTPRAAASAVAAAYLDFATRQPALYEAMFVLPTDLRFAVAETPPEARRAFASLLAVVAPFRADAELATETFWSTLHGVAELERTGRIRAAARHQRLDLIVGALSGGRGTGGEGT